MEADPKDIQFPVLCHYKIIAQDRQGLKEELEKIFFEVNISIVFELGNHSDHGKYVTFNASVNILSLELMRYLDRAIRAIDGVKFIL